MAIDPERTKFINRHSENLFKTLCDDAGLTPHHPTYDENGWDFYVEFPFNKVVNVFRDAQPPSIKLFCQVKSTDNFAEKSITMNVSNWDKLARNIHPSFVFVVDFAGGDKPAATYLCHFDNQRIAQALRRVRELDALGDRELHKRDMKFSVREDELYNFVDRYDLYNAILKHTTLDAAQYAKHKLKFLENIGYEKGRYILKFESKIAISELSKVQLGIKEMHIEKVQIFDNRFGIEMLHEEMAKGTIKITSNPIGRCKIIASSRKLSLRAEIEGDIYVSFIDESIIEGRSGRIVAGPIEIFINVGDTKTKFLFNHKKAVNFDELLQASRICQILLYKDCKFTIYSENKIIYNHAKTALDKNKAMIQSIAVRLDVLDNLLRKGGISRSFNISVEDLYDQKESFEWSVVLNAKHTCVVKTTIIGDREGAEKLKGAFAAQIFYKIQDKILCICAVWQAKLEFDNKNVTAYINKGYVYDARYFSSDDKNGFIDYTSAFRDYVDSSYAEGVLVTRNIYID